MGDLVVFIINAIVGLFVLAFSIIWIPLTYVAQFIHFLWRKLLGLDT